MRAIVGAANLAGAHQVVLSVDQVQVGSASERYKVFALRSHRHLVALVFLRQLDLLGQREEESLGVGEALLRKFDP